jgi:hypothetical protein
MSPPQLKVVAPLLTDAEAAEKQLVEQRIAAVQEREEVQQPGAAMRPAGIRWALLHWRVVWRWAVIWRWAVTQTVRAERAPFLR